MAVLYPGQVGEIVTAAILLLFGGAGAWYLACGSRDVALMIATFIADLFLLIACYANFRQWLEHRRYRTSYEGKSILLISKRHGWWQFHENNLRHALPEGITTVWNQDDGSDLHRDHGLYAASLMKAPSKLSRALAILTGTRSDYTLPRLPYLITISRDYVIGRSLHQELREVRQRGEKKSRQTQDRIREILRRTIEGSAPI